MTPNIQALINTYEKRRRNLINPDGETWESLGFDEPPEGFSTVEAWYLQNEYELDEGEQASLELIDEFLHELRKLGEVSGGHAHIPPDLCSEPCLVDKLKECLVEQGVPCYQVTASQEGGLSIRLSDDGSYEENYRAYIRPNHEKGGVDFMWEKIR